MSDIEAIRYPALAENPDVLEPYAKVYEIAIPERKLCFNEIDGASKYDPARNTDDARTEHITVTKEFVDDLVKLRKV